MSTHRLRLVLVSCAVVFASLLSAVPALAQSIFVTDTTEDATANQIAIHGGPFAANARVFLSLTELTVVSVPSPGEIVASLGSVPAGSHWLIVYLPSTGQVAQFWATTGAAKPAPTQATNAGRTHYTGNGWVLQSLSANLFALRSTTNGGPRAFSFVFPQNCGGTSVGFGDMTTEFIQSATAGDVVFGSVCNPGASLTAVVWEADTSTMTQLRCVRTDLNGNACQKF